MALDHQISEIKNLFITDLESIQSVKDLEDLKIKYLGKKGKVSSLMVFLKDASKEERPLSGEVEEEAVAEIREVLKEL